MARYGCVAALGCAAAVSIGGGGTWGIGGLALVALAGWLLPTEPRAVVAAVVSVAPAALLLSRWDDDGAVALWKVAGGYVVALGLVSIGREIRARGTGESTARQRRLVVVLVVAAVVLQVNAVAYRWANREADQRADEYVDRVEARLSPGAAPALPIELSRYLTDLGLNPGVVRGTGDDYSFTSEVHYFLAVRCVVVDVGREVMRTEVFKRDCDEVSADDGP